MNYSFEQINIKGEAFYLLPQKAIYRPAHRQLIISDLHLGKTSHFRKQGIALPLESHLKDLHSLSLLLDNWKPLSLLILGDLFHSGYNNEWILFTELAQRFSSIQFLLVKGNHDILNDEAYKISNLLVTDYIVEAEFVFSHAPLNIEGKINICGHVHPGIELRGRARQSVKLPCFYFNGHQLIMPAFGALTGLYLLEKEEDSDYYVITGNRVMKV